MLGAFLSNPNLSNGTDKEIRLRVGHPYHGVLLLGLPGGIEWSFYSILQKSLSSLPITVSVD